jgi:hypothetical protein
MPNSRSDLLGWVPVDLFRNDNHSGGPNGLIRWLDCSGVTFSEPFFLQTINRLRGDALPPQSVVTTMKVVERMFEVIPEHQPAGIVYHVSRCGSTAIANSLRHCPGTQVVSEAWPLTQLHWNNLLYGCSRDGFLWKASALKLAKLISWALSTCRTGKIEKLVLKLTSSSLLSFGHLRALWPDVPCVLIVRNPIEVLEASLSGSGWMELKNDVGRGPHLIGLGRGAQRNLAGMTHEEFGARVLGHFYELARRNLNELDLVLDHNEINPFSVLDVCRLFDLANCDERSITSELLLDAKQRDGSGYADDSLLRQSSASSSAIAAVARFAIKPYEELLAARL